MTRLEKLVFSVSLLDKVSQPIAKIQRQIDRFERMSGGSFSRLGGQIASAMKYGGIAVTGFVGLATNNLLSLQKELNAVSEAFNISQIEMQKWQLAGQIVGIESDKMTDIMKDVNDKIGDFSLTGGGEAKDLFEKLNLDIKEFKDLSPDKMILKIGAALNKADLSKSEKIFLLEGLADDASRLLPLLEGNAAVMKTLQLAEGSGAILTKADSKLLSEAEQKMMGIKLVSKGLTNQVGLLGARFLNAFGDDIALGIKDSAIWLRESWQNSTKLRQIISKISLRVFERGAEFIEGFSEGIKDALPPLDDFTYLILGVGNSLDDNTQNAKFWGDVLGSSLVYVTGTLLAFKLGLVATRAVMIAVMTIARLWLATQYLVRVVIIASTAATKLWAAALLMTKSAMAALPVLALIADLLLFKARLLATRLATLGVMTATTLWTATLWVVRGAMIAVRAVALIGFLATLATSFALATVPTMAFGVAMTVLTSPITLIILAVAALAAGAIYLYTHWDELKKAFVNSEFGKGIIEMFDSIVASFQPLIDGFKELKSLAIEKWGSFKAFIGVGDSKQTGSSKAANDSNYGGGRASGGRVHAGMFYEVNEKTPELIIQNGKTFLMNSHDAFIQPLGEQPSNVVDFQTVRERAEKATQIRSFNQQGDDNRSQTVTNNNTQYSQQQSAESTQTMRIENINIYPQQPLDPHELQQQLELMFG